MGTADAGAFLFFGAFVYDENQVSGSDKTNNAWAAGIVTVQR